MKVLTVSVQNQTRFFFENLPTYFLPFSVAYFFVPWPKISFIGRDWINIINQRNLLEKRFLVLILLLNGLFQITDMLTFKKHVFFMKNFFQAIASGSLEQVIAVISEIEQSLVGSSKKICSS